MDYGTLFKTVSNENILLQKNIQFLSDRNSTDDQKSKYENEQIQWFVSTNNYLFGIYYLLVLLFAMMIIVKNKKSIKNKFIIILPFLLYPFVIIFIEMGIYNFIQYIWTFIMLRAYPGNVFQ